MNIENLNNLIFSLDDDEQLRSFVFPNGMSYWLVIRYRLYLVLRSLVVEGHESGIDTPDLTAPSKVATLKQKVTNKLQHYKLSRSDIEVQKGQFDILNFFNATAVVNHEGKYESRITGFLNEINGISVLNVPQQPVFRSYGGASCYMEAMLRKSFATQVLKRQDITNIERFIHLLGVRSLMVTNDVGKFIKDILLSVAAQTLSFDGRIRSVLLRLKPKFVFVEEANQGGWVESSIIRVANTLDIQTAEFQHGSIDLAFRYGANLLRDPQIAIQKPAYFLTFGPYFSRQTNLVSKVAEIGHPFLERLTRKPVICPEAKDIVKILVIGQGQYTDSMFRVVADAMAKLNGKFLIQIKEHPIFPSSSVAMELHQNSLSVLLAREEDIYHMIACANVVIGYYSTVLMECLQFGKCPLVYKGPVSDEIIPPEAGKRFSDGDELAALINAQFSVIDFNLEFYWKKNAIENFNEFLEFTTNGKCAE